MEPSAHFDEFRGSFCSLSFTSWTAPLHATRVSNGFNIMGFHFEDPTPPTHDSASSNLHCVCALCRCRLRRAASRCATWRSLRRSSATRTTTWSSGSDTSGAQAFTRRDADRRSTRLSTHLHTRLHLCTSPHPPLAQLHHPCIIASLHQLHSRSCFISLRSHSSASLFRYTSTFVWFACFTFAFRMYLSVTIDTHPSTNISYFLDKISSVLWVLILFATLDRTRSNLVCLQIGHNCFYNCRNISPLLLCLFLFDKILFLQSTSANIPRKILFV